MEDCQIIDLYWERNETAITETDTKYGSFCRRISTNILRNPWDSEECVSDAYARCWDTMPPQRPMSLRAYLGAILRNLSISRYRAEHAQKRFGGAEVLLSELSDCVPGPENVQRTVEAEELGRLISDWLEGLAKEERVLFVRRYWNGDSVKMLAGEMGLRPNAVTKRLLRLRENLRRTLEKEGISV